ncbi:MAG: hypothetical protein U5K79_11610 [Cyclobacteriaceae bacterium]|nr:hypothetical protein [Cyclobacteriaceae bacterium]
MNDKLEKFIKTHRAALDVKEPSSELWGKIAREIAQEKKIEPASRSLIYWRVAAAVLFFATSALLIDKFVYQETTPEVIATTTNPALIEAEGYYMNLISQMNEEITAYSQNDYTDPHFIHDMNSLDSVYQVLKQDLVLGNQQNIIDAMIQNLQLRIEVLNNQLEIIQSIEKFKREENESVNI